MFAVAVLPPGYDMGRAPVHFVPFLNGKRLLTTQAFRDLFRSEVIKAREGIGVKDITLLFTDLKGSTALYDRSEEHTSELQSPDHLVCRLLLEKKKYYRLASS